MVVVDHKGFTLITSYDLDENGKLPILELNGVPVQDVARVWRAQSKKEQEDFCLGGDARSRRAYPTS